MFSEGRFGMEHPERCPLQIAPYACNSTKLLVIVQEVEHRISSISTKYHHRVRRRVLLRSQETASTRMNTPSVRRYSRALDTNSSSFFANFAGSPSSTARPYQRPPGVSKASTSTQIPHRISRSSLLAMGSASKAPFAFSSAREPVSTGIQVLADRRVISAKLAGREYLTARVADLNRDFARSVLASERSPGIPGASIRPRQTSRRISGSAFIGQGEGKRGARGRLRDGEGGKKSPASRLHKTTDPSSAPLAGSHCARTRILGRQAPPGQQEPRRGPGGAACQSAASGNGGEGKVEKRGEGEREGRGGTERVIEGGAGPDGIALPVSCLSRHVLAGPTRNRPDCLDDSFLVLVPIHRGASLASLALAARSPGSRAGVLSFDMYPAPFPPPPPPAPPPLLYPSLAPLSLLETEDETPPRGLEWYTAGTWESRA
ncbi:hypothetical protein KM043_011113 [Ampulex compressa]|nr:hypothetical protein KM043_011113 [Ampulex compressa]